MKRYLSMLLIVSLLSFSIINVPKAHANPLMGAAAVAGGIETAAFVYAGMVLSGAAIASRFDDDVAQALADHAQKAYDTLDSAAKTTWDTTIQAIDWAGDKAVTLGSAVVSHIASKMKQLEALDGLIATGATIGEYYDSTYTSTWRYLTPAIKVSNRFEVSIDLQLYRTASPSSYNYTIAVLTAYVTDIAYGRQTKTVYLKDQAPYNYYKYPNQLSGGISEWPWSLDRMISDSLILYMSQNFPNASGLPLNPGSSLRLPNFQDLYDGTKGKYKIPGFDLGSDGVVRDLTTGIPTYDVNNPATVPDTSLANPPATTTPGTTTPIPGVSIPSFTVPPTATINLQPLLIAGESLKTKFPFSIPWDLKNQLDVFNVTPKTPKINVDIPQFVKIGSLVMPLKFQIDFSMFDPIAAAARWFFTIAIDIAFILSIRRFLPE